MKSKPLGKGLQALFEESPLSDYIDTGKKFLEIPVNKVKPNPMQPREGLEAEQLEPLKDSIKRNGLIQPIAVRQVNDAFEIIAGERRWRAVKEIGYETIPAYIIKIDESRDMLSLSMLENIHRSNLTPIEIARGYQQLNTQFGLKQQEISEAFSVDRSTVANMIRLLRLPEEIQQSLKDGAIGMGHARALLALPSRAEQRALYKRILKEHLSVRQVEVLLKSSGAAEKKPLKPAPKKSPAVAQLEDRFRRILGSQVRIKTRGSGGKIEIDFYSMEDLDRLAELFVIIEKKY